MAQRSGEHIYAHHPSQRSPPAHAGLSIVAKTSGIILGPPAYLIALMVKIAAKISASGWNTSPDRIDNSDDDVLAFCDFLESDINE